MTFALLEVYRNITIRPMETTIRTKDYHILSRVTALQAGTKKFATTSHLPSPFSIKEAWIILWDTSPQSSPSACPYTSSLDLLPCGEQEELRLGNIWSKGECGTQTAKHNHFWWIGVNTQCASETANCIKLCEPRTIRTIFSNGESFLDKHPRKKKRERERNRYGKREISNGVVCDLKPIAPLWGISVIWTGKFLVFLKWLWPM